jgi:hypothetical protein
MVRQAQDERLFFNQTSMYSGFLEAAHVPYLLAALPPSMAVVLAEMTK